MYNVLIVEDEHYLLQELTSTVEWERYGCIIAGATTDGESAIKLAELIKPDLIITDIRLPGMDGLNLLKELLPPAAIVITGYDQFEYARDALRIGVTDFLLKPIDDKELHTAIRKATFYLSGQDQPTLEVLSSSPKTHNKYRHVTGAQRFIERHYQEDVSLLQAAEDLSLSESYLSRIFKECTGKTFVEALTEYRLKIAQNLLQDSRLRIEEVALMSGFRNAGYFTRIFKRSTGMAPSYYRCIENDV
ncbi:MAG: response regulator [Spirochaetaceae bacterium]|nr:response regulator [Spirochaetaceae bacterium]MCF7949675.1 response regulator [Spirochaetia bacterium]MCF7951624.1 response regulator [Spirochaetaceae bacterium]